MINGAHDRKFQISTAISWVPSKDSIVSMCNCTVSHIGKGAIIRVELAPIRGAGIGTTSAPVQKCGSVGAVLQGATSMRDTQGEGGLPPPLKIGLRYDLGEMPPAEFAAQSPVILAIAG